MKLTYSKNPDEHGNHHVKADGVLIGNIRQETYADKEVRWVWRTLAVVVRHNMSGEGKTIEEAAEQIKASNPELL